MYRVYVNTRVENSLAGIVLKQSIGLGMANTVLVEMTTSRRISQVDKVK